MIKYSYTAANCLPAKILQNHDLMREIVGGHTPLYHANLFPTDRCNYKCSFCSCSKKGAAELPLEDIRQLVRTLPSLGTRAITVSGGGEPMCHPHINEIFLEIAEQKMDAGLTTNGSLLERLEVGTMKWCRVSACDERKINGNIRRAITVTAQRFPHVDWATSYVVGPDFDPENLREYVLLSNGLNFTHIRVVCDLFSLDKVPSMQDIQKPLQGIDDRVIYQGRKNFVHGRKKCYASLLRPVINADGYIYPCCGIQYAREPPDRKMPEDLRMGHVSDIGNITQPFDGSQCVRCYYDEYNELLSLLAMKVEHHNFV